MRGIRSFFCDESGLILSAEMVAIGTLGVAGAAVGAGALASSVNSELEEVAFAIRSLDQSYHVPALRSGDAWSAGSSFTQKPVCEAHEELRREIEAGRKEEAARLKELQERADSEAQSSSQLKADKQNRSDKDRESDSKAEKKKEKQQPQKRDRKRRDDDDDRERASLELRQPVPVVTERI